MFAYAPDLSAARSRTRLGQEPVIVADAIEAPLLMVDDVGAGRWDADMLEEVIHKRHQALMPTWVTTWMTSTTMGTRFGGGFARRVYEGARLLDFGGAT